MPNPAVSIIVLNYNSREDTLECLRSLEHLTYPSVQVIAVDNGSTDGSVEAIRQAYPALTLIDTGKNLGFTGGNNVGIRHALEHGADYVMLLNNDTIVAPDMIDVMIDVMEKDPTIGVCGPMIYYFDAPDVIWSAGGSIDWKHGTTFMIGLDREDKSQFGLNPRSVDFVTGCAILARRAVWERVGLLDDKFFMYYEETEWCVRAGRAGYKIVHIPAAMMWHKISTEARAASPRTHYYMTRNRLLFLHSSEASLQTWLYTSTELARTLLSWTIRPKWQDKRHLRGVMLRAIRDYSLGRFWAAPGIKIMRILFLSWWWPYPPDNGSKIRIYNLLRNLAKVFDVTLLSFGEPAEISAEQLEHMRAICHHVEIIPRPHPSPNMLQKIQGYFAPWPRSMVYNYSPAMDEQVRKIIQTQNIDVVVASQIDTMRYLELAAGIPVILEEAEVTSFYNRVQQANGPARMRARLTLDKLTHALRVITEHGASLTVVSEAEREYIRGFIPDNTRIEVIPNGVDTHNYQPSAEAPQPYTLIYPGAVTYNANYDAVSYFIQDVLPLVRQRVPQAQFTITGDTGSVDVSQLANQPGVTFSGYLDSVASAVQQSWATVVPLRQGGGTRLKILESMALGTPVISTRKGAEGLNIHPNQDILIADTPEEMADVICSLFENQQLRASLAASGHTLVKCEYDWAVISSKLIHLIEEVASKGA